MGKVKTAAAKKYIEKNDSSSDDEEVTNSKRSTRTPKKSSAPAKNQSSGRPTRSSAPIAKENGKNGVSKSSSSESDSDDDEPIVSRKRKSSVGNTTPKKQKPSTSQSPSKSKQTERKSKKQKKAEEERYEVEEILDHKIEGATKYFLIRWKGYDSSVDSWEMQRDISCPGLLAKYFEEHPEASIPVQRGKKSKKKKKTTTEPKPRQLKIDEQLDYDSTDWDESEDYEVERILDVYMHRDNKRDFLIRWKGYSSKSDSWEPEENLDCKDLIKQFMEKVDKVKNLNEKELRPVRQQTQRFTLMTQGAARRLSKRKAGQQRAVYYDCEE